MKAPVYANSLGLRFFGDVDLWLQQGWMTVRGRRAKKGPGGGMMVGGVLLIVFAVLALLLGLVAAGSSDDPRDTPITLAVLAGGAVGLAAGLALYLPGRAMASKGDVEQLQFHLGQTKGGRVHYDSNLGCLLSLLLSPVIGVVVMLARGKRTAAISVPSPDDGRMKPLILRVSSNNDGAAIDQIWRMR